uniref:Uncharacterized protein n=1 Tax=Aegilops tauschii subsp. strangulata TaxID=200361 RepID=A0A452Z8Z9_AEGTS
MNPTKMRAPRAAPGRPRSGHLRHALLLLSPHRRRRASPGQSPGGVGGGGAISRRSGGGSAALGVRRRWWSRGCARRRVQGWRPRRGGLGGVLRAPAGCTAMAQGLGGLGADLRVGAWASSACRGSCGDREAAAGKLGRRA